MAHFYLIGGHGDGDVGAVGNGYQEYALARQFNDLLAKHLKALGHKVTVYNKNRDMYKQTAKGQGLNVFGVNGRVVIETHLNAAYDKSANGCETLIKSGLKPDKYDKAIQNTLKKYFKDRGIKYRNDLLNMNVASNRGINYRLVELCFISNKKDVDKLVKQMNNIARDMAVALNGGNEGTPKPPKPKSKRAYIKKGYVVNVRFSPSVKGRLYRTLKYPMKTGLLLTGNVYNRDGYEWYEYKTAGKGLAYFTVNDENKKGNKFFTIK